MTTRAQAKPQIAMPQFARLNGEIVSVWPGTNGELVQTKRGTVAHCAVAHLLTPYKPPELPQ